MIISNFILKLIALIAMTIDHVGVFLPSSPLQYAFRIIGKIAFPIFIYTTFEGCRKTSNIKKYMIKLLIMAAFMYISISVANVILHFYSSGEMLFQNIFLTLFALTFSYYILFVNKKKAMKSLIILPVLLFIGSYAFYLSRENGFSNFYYNCFIDGFTTMYSLEGPIMFFIMILGNYIYEKIIKKRLNDEQLSKEFLNSKKAQLSRNLIMVVSTICISLIMYLITYINIPRLRFGGTIVYNTYFALSSIFIILYNGKRGFNNKYVNGAFYLYYPLHIGIIALIFMLIGGF